MPDDFTIRVAQPQDASALDDLITTSYATLMASHYAPEDLTALLPMIGKANPALLSSGTYYVAETADGQIAGCGGWTAERPGTGEIQQGWGHIRHFATHPDWTGQGVGRLIFAQCHADAKAAGLSNFECFSSLNAEPFYTVMGFRRVRPETVMIGPAPMPSILMTRSL